MPSYRLHCFAQSGHAYKVALALNLMKLDWAPVFVDFFAGETRTAAWREAVNEMGEVPVLETGDQKLTQSGAILAYLSEKTGQFVPTGDRARHECLRWMFFDNHKLTSYLATYRFLRSLAPTPGDPAVLGFLRTRVDGALGVVETHMAGTAFVLGDKPTIADLSMVGYLYYPAEEHGYDFATSHPSIARWLDRVSALPGWKHPYDLMPGHPRTKA